MITIESELSCLTNLLHQSSKTTADLGEKIMTTLKSIKLPDAFENLDDANRFLNDFRDSLNPIINDLSEVIAASYIDDLGGQSIQRIQALIGCGLL